MVNFLKKIKKLYQLCISKKKAEVDNRLSEESQDYTLNGNNHVKRSSIGKNSYLAYNTIIETTDIGRYCSIGPNCVIGFGDHPISILSTSPIIYFNSLLISDQEIDDCMAKNYQRVEIKNDVWIGANVFIKNGVVVGNGAVIGAGSIVLENVPDYAIVVGTPAKVIKYRFDIDVIQRLLISNWWNLDIEDLRLNKIDVLNKDIIKVIEQLEAMKSR